MPLVRGRIARVQLYRTLEFALGCSPVPIVGEQDVGQGSVSLGRAFILLDSQPRGLLGLGHSVLGRERVVTGGPQQRVLVRQSGISRRVARIEMNTAFEA